MSEQLPPIRVWTRATREEVHECVIFPLKPISCVLCCSPPPACCLSAPERGLESEQRGSSVSLKQWSCVQAREASGWNGNGMLPICESISYKHHKFLVHVFLIMCDRVCVGVLLRAGEACYRSLICLWSPPHPHFAPFVSFPSLYCPTVSLLFIFSSWSSLRVQFGILQPQASADGSEQETWLPHT